MVLWLFCITHIFLSIQGKRAQADVLSSTQGDIQIIGDWDRTSQLDACWTAVICRPILGFIETNWELITHGWSCLGLRVMVKGIMATETTISFVPGKFWNLEVDWWKGRFTILSPYVQYWKFKLDLHCPVWRAVVTCLSWAFEVWLILTQMCWTCQMHIRFWRLSVRKSNIYPFKNTATWWNGNILEYWDK